MNGQRSNLSQNARKSRAQMSESRRVWLYVAHLQVSELCVVDKDRSQSVQLGQMERHRGSPWGTGSGR